MASRKITEVNAGSMADIAFLLLIFFLVTTTMDVDSGISRKLPPPIPPNQKKPPEVKKRNVFVVLINSADQLLLNGRQGSIRTLKRDVKEFLTPVYSGNPSAPDVDGHPEVTETNIDGIGRFWRSKGVVSMQNDRGTSYATYIHVQNELAAAVSELRDDMAKQYFGTDLKTLLDKYPDKAKAIQDAIPMSISEAEPVSLGD
ncbi:MAG: biopolymer transporter ExbD [Bacteroidales bacterium]|nr:biopolymer transporter ExbD [Bacteroidales bacterium]